jgi:hypothetical protein
VDDADKGPTVGKDLGACAEIETIGIEIIKSAGRAADQKISVVCRYSITKGNNDHRPITAIDLLLEINIYTYLLA